MYTLSNSGNTSPSSFSFAEIKENKEESEDYFTMQPLPDGVDTTKWKEEFILTKEEWEQIVKKGDKNESTSSN